MRIEYAELSLLGGRENNQDRVAVAIAAEAALLLVADGMGGHALGEQAAQAAQRLIVERFWATPQPLLDPLGFLHLALGAAHREVVDLGQNLPLDQRPRATCAVCVIQDASAYWAHVGDSRIYHLRGGRTLERTRDHSHVELLVREGVISPGQMQNHPMRNFVESCLGGEPLLPEMTISPRHGLQPGDVVLLCTDGLWAVLEESVLSCAFAATDVPLRDTLSALGAAALANAGVTGDNTSAVALRFLE